MPPADLDLDAVAAWLDADPVAAARFRRWAVEPVDRGDTFRLNQRDAALRRFAETMPPALSVRGRAMFVADRLAEYRRTGWCEDRMREAPRRASDQPWFDVFAAVDRDIGMESVRKILGNESS